MSFQAIELLVAAAGMDIGYCGRRSVEAVPALVVDMVLLLVRWQGGSKNGARDRRGSLGGCRFSYHRR
jgi:hypothetical protein